MPSPEPNPIAFRARDTMARSFHDHPHEDGSTEQAQHADVGCKPRCQDRRRKQFTPKQLGHTVLKRMKMKSTCAALLWVVMYFSPVHAQPDVIVGDLNSVNSYGNAGDVYAYAVGTTSCNVGDVPLSWISSTNEHPVIGQSLYRFKDGRFQQLGQSWLKHGFLALSGSLCDPCSGPGGSMLSPGCSDPYGASLNGNQSGLGMKSEVNASTGIFQYPPTNPLWSGPIDRRVQVHRDDLDPTLNPGALYYSEGQYVAADDAQAGNGANNASYRSIAIADDSTYSASFTGPTIRQLPAIYAWQANDPAVEIRVVDVAGDGRYIVAYKATEIPGTGSWHYEYAIHNINSHLSAQAFNLPISDSISLANTGFSDVDYHSGEPFSSTDWDFGRVSGVASWSTDDFATDANANAIRWGTLYNFWFDANAAPVESTATISMFRSPGPAFASVSILVPGDVTGVPAPTNLTCVELNHDVTLNWTNQASYDEVRILRDGALLETLPPGTETYVDEDLIVGGPYLYQVSGTVGSAVSAPAICSTFVIGLPAPSDLDCSETAGDVTLNWANPIPYTELSLARDGLVIAVLPGTTTTYTDGGLLSGFYSYSITGTDGVNESAAAECTLLVTGGPATGDVLLYAPPGAGGGAGIEAALTANGQNVITVTNMSGVTPADFDASFIALGIFPNNYALTQLEGTTFASYVEAGGRVFFEGGDTFSFDSSTDLHAIDGITGLSDGSADLFSIDGLDSGLGLQFVSYQDLTYTGENSWIDHLASSGPSAGLIWGNADNSDNIGVFKSASLIGPIIGCSYQFEGLGSETDRQDVMAMYLAAFGLPGGAVGQYIRGDANSDGLVNVSDTVHMLAFLFVPGSPNLGCADAADVNDDGANDLVDAIYLLNHLFISGAPPLNPFPSCGVDKTDDTLECLEVTLCP